LVSNASSIATVGSAGVEIPNGSSRARVDLAPFSSIRLQYSVGDGSNQLRCRAEYSTDAGATWNILVADVSNGGADQNNTGAYATIPAAALQDVLVRAVLSGNNTMSVVAHYVRLDVQ
jgi:hypothetical protein